MNMGIVIENEVVESSFHGGFAFLSALLCLIIFISINNQTKRIKNDYPDNWKEHLFASYLLGFVLSLGSYFLLVNNQ